MSSSYPRDEREVAESPKIQGAWESRAYSFDFTGCGVTTIEDQAAVVLLDGADVTADVMPSGSASATGLVVTTPQLTSLTAGGKYRLHARVTHDGGQQSELFCWVFARD